MFKKYYFEQGGTCNTRRCIYALSSEKSAQTAEKNSLQLVTFLVRFLAKTFNKSPYLTLTANHLDVNLLPLVSCVTMNRLLNLSMFIKILSVQCDFCDK